MESNNEEDNKSLVENKARACNVKGLHIFNTYVFHLVGLQGLLRVVSFIFKRIMLSYLTIEQFGLQVVQYDTFTTFIYCIGREGFRCGCLRQSKCNVGEDADSKWVQSNSRVLAAAWLTMPWGIIVALVILSFAMWWQGLHVFHDYNSSIFILGIATILEFCCEPLYILAQHLLLVRLRVFIEVMATIIRYFITYILVHQGIGVDVGQAFVYAQVAYSCCLLLFYWSYFLFIYQGPSIFPFKLVYYPSNIFLFGFKRNLEFESALIHLCFKFTCKSFFNFFQQNGGNFLLVLYETTHIQGIYGLVDNMGSLVVRSIFQPFEESAFIMFAKENHTANAIDKKSKNNCNIERMFLLTLKLASFIGLVFVAFGPNFAYVLLRLYKKDWSDGNTTTALGYYCIYILILAVNGIIEAFIRAVITQQELSNCESFLKLIFFSIAFIFLNRILLYAASSNGLILAKSIIMGMQMYYSLHFIRQYFKHSQTFSFGQALPNWRVLGMLVTSALITYLSKSFVLDFKNFFPTAILHIGVGVACLCGLIVVVFKYESSFLGGILAFQNKKRD